jgi:uncharacterized protein
MQVAAVLPPTDDLRERVLAYLADRTVLSLATAGPAGLWAAAVLYVNDGIVLYFTSVATTRHGINMRETGEVAGTVSDECRQWTAMKGLQLEGTVERVDDHAERLRVVRAYLARFPFAAGLWHGERDPDVIARDPGVHGFYRITPTKLLFTDNEHGPGMREELPIG